MRRKILVAILFSCLVVFGFALTGLLFGTPIVSSSWSAGASYTCIGTYPDISCSSSGQGNPTFPIGSKINDTAIIEDPNGIYGVCDPTLHMTSGCVNGNVKFSLYSGSSCSSNDLLLTSAQIGPNPSNNYPGYFPYTFTYSFQLGQYSIEAEYQGNYNDNNGWFSIRCEPFSITQTEPSITTSVMPSSSVSVGVPVYDTSVISNGYDPSGTVTYTLFSDSSSASSSGCLTTNQIGSPYVVTVAGNSVPNSNTATLSAGYYSYQAVYSGDTNNKPATSSCELFRVSMATPSITTTLSPTSTVLVGTAVSDNAILTGAYYSSGATVQYNVFSGSSCNSQSLLADYLVTVSSSGSVPNSPSYTFTGSGSYSWDAIFNGNANNKVASSACEPLTVQMASPTITTALMPSSSIVVGTPVHDTSALSGGYNPSGAIEYQLFSGSSCDSVDLMTNNTVAIGVGNINIPSSTSVTLTAGTYSWDAIYNGDSNNNGATSQCEPLTVSMAIPRISTTLSSSMIIVGNSVYDIATLSGGYNPTGTVTFYYSTSSGPSCASSATLVSAISVSGDGTYGSASLSSATFTATGNYYWYAVYSGDSNNIGSSSPCSAEPLIVTPQTPSISTSLSVSTITVGGSDSDYATISGGYNPTGYVTFFVSSSSSCTQSSSSQVGSAIPVIGDGTSGPSASMQFDSAGTYYWYAVYSGDTNNVGAASGCELLTVSQATPTIGTLLSPALTVVVGTSVYDTSTLSGTYGSAGSTVQYNLFYGDSCTGANLITDFVVSVSNNAMVPNSTSYLFTNAGAYSWDANYSGNSNNAPAQSVCEPLNVQSASPSITTSLVPSSSIVAGTLVYDTASISGGYNPSGLVNYELFSNNSTCNGNPTVYTVAIGGSGVPDSPAILLNAGNYSWKAVYLGDGNNNAAASPCEPLNVSMTSPTITTSLSSSTISHNQAVSDTATLSGVTGNAGGYITFYYATSMGVCTPNGAGVQSVGSPVSVDGPNTYSSSSITLPKGTYYWFAVYSGDANNPSVTSPCNSESLLVTPEFPLGSLLAILAPLAAIGLYFGQRRKFKFS